MPPSQPPKKPVPPKASTSSPTPPTTTPPATPPPPKPPAGPSAGSPAEPAPQNNAAEKKRGSHTLTIAILTGIVAAIIVALVFPHFAMRLEVGGLIFLRLLQMVVVPLVMASVMAGILGLGDIRKLGRPGGYAVLYYLSTTILAVGTGLIVVNIVQPGEGINPALVQTAQEEGAREVERKSGAHQTVTWYGGGVTTRVASGVSDPFSVPDEDGALLRIQIVQEGTAEVPARVVVEASEDGTTFAAMGEPLLAGQEENTYHWNVTLPRKARQGRLVYTAAEGGLSSAIFAESAPGPPSISAIGRNLLLMLFTDNLLKSMVEIDLLPLIVFSIVFAGMLTTMGSLAAPVTGLVVAINDALMRFIMLLMKVAPLGIFCLVAARFGQAQADGSFIELIQVQFYYIITVLSGLAVHLLVTLPLILWVFTRRNPYRFILQMSQAVLTAFSTASSTATLPITMEAAEMNAGVSKRSCEFVLPLGSTINMDGTALYEAAAAIFIAQAYAMVNPDFTLTFASQLVIALTATLAAIGAAGIPEAGLVTLLIVLNAVNLPLELIGLILPLDWMLDRFRTAVNVFGDSVGAAVVDPTFPQSHAPAAQLPVPKETPEMAKG